MGGLAPPSSAEVPPLHIICAYSADSSPPKYPLEPLQRREDLSNNLIISALIGSSVDKVPLSFVSLIVSLQGSQIFTPNSVKLKIVYLIYRIHMST